MWTCTKCGGGFEPVTTSRICCKCRNTHCADCGTELKNRFASAERCTECNRLRAIQRASAHYRANKDAKREYDASRRKAKRHLYRAASKRHRESHREKKNIETNVRRRRHRQATPSWANSFFIKEIYELSSMRSKATGIKMHVDHIIPLTNPLVCGLHVHNNLQILTAKENMAKNNHYSFSHWGRW